MQQVTFYECRFGDSKSLISREKLLSKFYGNRNKFLKDIADDLWCPECEVAQLSFVKKAQPYLKTRNNCKHALSCSYTVQVAAPVELRGLLEKKENNDDTGRLVENTLSSLLNPKDAIKKPSPLIIEYRRPLSKNKNNPVSQKVKKRVPLRSITANLAKDDFGTYKLFYGDVLLKWKDESDEQYDNSRTLQIIKPKEVAPFCSIYMSKGVAHFIQKKEKKIPYSTRPTPYKIVLLTELSLSSYNYITGKIGFSVFIAAEPIQS